MPEPAPAVGGKTELHAVDLLAAKHVPEPELDQKQPILLKIDTARDKRIGLDQLPVGKPWLDRDIQGPLDKGFLRDQGEQTRAFEVGAHDPCDLLAHLALFQGGALKVHHGDRHGLVIAARDVDLQLGMGAQRQSETNKGGDEEGPKRGEQGHD